VLGVLQSLPQFTVEAGKQSAPFLAQQQAAIFERFQRGGGG